MLGRSLACLVAVAVSALALTAAGGTSSPAAAHERWNVVVILSDDERYDAQPTMRNARRLLASDGVTFTEFHVTTSECCPSRASILSGQYAHHHGVVENFGRASYPAFDDSSTLATWLHGAGYRTALVGKYLNDYTIFGKHRVPPGWDTWATMDSVPEESYYDYTLNLGGRLVRHGSAPSDYSTTVLTRHALQFLRRGDPKQPFFLYFAPIAPHLPATPAPRDVGSLHWLPPLREPSFNERDLSDKPWRAWHARPLSPRGRRYVEDGVRRRQLESLRALDRSIAQIVGVLRERRLLDQTVIFYLSDNGFLLGEHRLGGKIWPYEESTHVPLVVRVPWSQGRGTSNDNLVLNIDLASTIAHLAGVKPNRPQDGRSFSGLLHGEKQPWRVDFLVEYRGQNVLRQGGPSRFKAVRDRRFLYVEYDRGWRELYDHLVDPYELRNVAGSPAYAKVQERLHRRIASLYGAPSRPVR